MLIGGMRCGWVRRGVRMSLASRCKSESVGQGVTAGGCRVVMYSMNLVPDQSRRPLPICHLCVQRVVGTETKGKRWSWCTKNLQIAEAQVPVCEENEVQQTPPCSKSSGTRRVLVYMTAKTDMTSCQTRDDPLCAVQPRLDLSTRRSQGGIFGLESRQPLV